MITLMCDLVVQTCNISTFINTIARARTTKFLRAACVFEAHKEYYAKRPCRFASEVADDDLGSFFDRCLSWNGSLGPSEKQATEVYLSVVNQQRSFFLRYMGGKILQNSIKCMFVLIHVCFRHH